MSHCHNHSRCIATALKKAEAYCAENNLRLTESREQVLRIIWGSHKALTANGIMHALGNSQPPITYRALQFLQENGLIHHIATLNAYIGCPHIGEPHDGQLVICKSCHEVTELHTPLTKLEEHASSNGFRVEHMQVEVLGTCAACQSGHATTR